MVFFILEFLLKFLLFLIYFLLFQNKQLFIDVYLIYNVVSVFGVQQRDSVIYIFFFKVFPL